MKMSKNKKNKKASVEKMTIDWSYFEKVVSYASLLFFLILILPFTKAGLPSGHDVYIHSTYIFTFYKALRDGQFPVRWTDWITPGLGQPIFNFYQPGFFYFVSFLMAIGFKAITSIKIFIVSVWLMSALFMYLFAKRFMSRLGALSSTFLFTFAPYHIVDIFVRSAYPEFTALSFVPVVLWSIQSFIDTKKRVFLPAVSVSVAVVAISHPPTLIMLGFFLFFYLLFLFYNTRSIWLLIYLILSLINGIIIASFFLLPAFAERPFIQSVFLKSGSYSYKDHWVCLPQLFKPFWGYGISTIGCNDGMSFQIGVPHLILVSIGFFALLFKKQSLDLQFKIMLSGLLTIFLIALFLTNSYSTEYWKLTPFLDFFQYPWRWLLIAILVSSIVGGILISKLNSPFRLIAFILLCLGIFVFYGKLMHPAENLTEDKIKFSDNTVEIKIPEDEKPSPELGYFPKNAYIQKSNVPENEIEIIHGEGIVEKFDLKADRKSYLLKLDTDTEIIFYTPAYPGWKLMLDGNNAHYIFTPEFGLIKVAIPKGEHNVELMFTNTFIRKFSNLLSLIGIVTAILFLRIPQSKLK